MAASIADYRQQVNGNQISFSEALLELTNKEIAYQQQESLKRRIKRARFPIIKRLNEFDYQFQPSINQQQIAEFATMSFLDNQENIIFIGSPGVGKNTPIHWTRHRSMPARCANIIHKLPRINS